MAVLPKTAEWVDEIDGVNISDPVSGGESGAVNLRLASLAKRTEYLKVQLAEAAAEITTVAELVGGINVSDALIKSKNLADVPNKADARANLGVATADHNHNGVYLKVSESLSDVPDSAAALDAIGAAAKEHTHEQYSPYFIGEYKLMAHDNVPASSGFVKAVGTLFNLGKYPKAFEVFGVRHGGDGITTFAVPDWRADAIRINDDGRGIDSGRVIGSEQADAMQRITGSIGTIGINGTVNGVFYVTGSAGSINNSGEPDLQVAFDSGRVVRTAAETRMRNRTCYMYVYIGRPGIDA